MAVWSTMRTGGTTMPWLKVPVEVSTAQVVSLHVSGGPGAGGAGPGCGCGCGGCGWVRRAWGGWCVVVDELHPEALVCTERDERLHRGDAAVSRECRGPHQRRPCPRGEPFALGLGQDHRGVKGLLPAHRLGRREGLALGRLAGAVGADPVDVGLVQRQPCSACANTKHRHPGTDGCAIQPRFAQQVNKEVRGWAWAWARARMGGARGGRARGGGGGRWWPTDVLLHPPLPGPGVAVVHVVFDRRSLRAAVGAPKRDNGPGTTTRKCSPPRCSATPVRAMWCDRK